MTLEDAARMYGVLAWLIPSVISAAALIVVALYVSRDRTPRSARRKRGF